MSQRVGHEWPKCFFDILGVPTFDFRWVEMVLHHMWKVWVGKIGRGFHCEHGRISLNLFTCLARMGSVVCNFETKFVVGSTPMPIDCKGKTGFDRHRSTTDVQCTLSTRFLFYLKLEQHKTCAEIQILHSILSEDQALQLT